MQIESMYGMVYQRAGYYIRRSSKGKLYSCRCPDRSGHVKTPAEAPNQRLCRQTPKILRFSLHMSKKSCNFARKIEMQMKKSAIIVPEGCRRVLLHACCAPCSSAIVEWLQAHGIQPVIYYFNPNIYPEAEYEIRKAESKRHAESLGIEWLEGPYDHDAWLRDIKGLENEPERGNRCSVCFYHRLKATAEKAAELGTPYFATTLASSRWKNIDQVNAAGLRACETLTPNPLTPTPSFWPQNWRKDGLQDRRNELLKQYNFYNQLYCGCEFSCHDH